MRLTSRRTLVMHSAGVWTSLACLFLGLAGGCNYGFTVLDPDGGVDATVDATVDANPLCGNGVIDTSEDCDGTHLGGETCVGLGYLSGTLGCTVACEFDTNACIGSVCGNGIIEAGEECDGTNLDGETCVTRGFVAGELVCQGCAFDTGPCGNNCGGLAPNACPASSISDNFDDGIQGVIWGGSFTNGLATMQETNGELVLVPPEDAFGYAAYMTDDTYDLRTYAITVEVVSGTNPVTTAEFSLELVEAATGDFCGVSVSGGQLVVFYYLGVTLHAVASLPFDLATHRYWRLSERGGSFVFDTSMDGASWMQWSIVADPFPMDEIRIAIKAGTWEAVTNPGEARFDNFNILP